MFESIEVLFCEFNDQGLKNGNGDGNNRDRGRLSIR